MIKQVIVIRKDLNLRRGKEIAQGSHASMMWLSNMLKDIGGKLAIIYAFGLAMGCVILHLHWTYFPTAAPIVVMMFAIAFGLILTLPAVAFRVLFNHPQRLWLLGSFAKVCLQVDSEDKLLKVYWEAKQAGLMVEKVIDSGKTEFHGVPTLTAIAIGPDYNEKIDLVTGHLKLY